eukprot:CAMPEP_0179007914 /NCGR_PEP_ID=MMETSP0795-20121207/15421_1 /TAXON_ID=88552 /ORGANISM="Amoebophrya sp., Strain Ameob2" /LENGTH=859 /DNA_ID=CAMNT_0020702933 /DNA_START=240 /DNA_END=2820 /DNA_ORIENTATION=-
MLCACLLTASVVAGVKLPASPAETSGNASGAASSSLDPNAHSTSWAWYTTFANGAYPVSLPGSPAAGLPTLAAAPQNTQEQEEEQEQLQQEETVFTYPYAADDADYLSPATMWRRQQQYEAWLHRYTELSPNGQNRDFRPHQQQDIEAGFVTPPDGRGYGEAFRPVDDGNGNVVYVPVTPRHEDTPRMLQVGGVFDSPRFGRVVRRMPEGGPVGVNRVLDFGDEEVTVPVGAPAASGGSASSSGAGASGTDAAVALAVAVLPAAAAADPPAAAAAAAGDGNEEVAAVEEVAPEVEVPVPEVRSPQGPPPKHFPGKAGYPLAPPPKHAPGKAGYPKGPPPKHFPGKAGYPLAPHPKHVPGKAGYPKGPPPKHFPGKAGYPLAPHPKHVPGKAGYPQGPPPQRIPGKAGYPLAPPPKHVPGKAGYPKGPPPTHFPGKAAPAAPQPEPETPIAKAKASSWVFPRFDVQPEAEPQPEHEGPFVPRPTAYVPPFAKPAQMPRLNAFLPPFAEQPVAGRASSGLESHIDPASEYTSPASSNAGSPECYHPQASSSTAPAPYVFMPQPQPFLDLACLRNSPHGTSSETSPVLDELPQEPQSIVRPATPAPSEQNVPTIAQPVSRPPAQGAFRWEAPDLEPEGDNDMEMEGHQNDSRSPQSMVAMPGVQPNQDLTPWTLLDGYNHWDHVPAEEMDWDGANRSLLDDFAAVAGESDNEDEDHVEDQTTSEAREALERMGLSPVAEHDAVSEELQAALSEMVMQEVDAAQGVQAAQELNATTEGAHAAAGNFAALSAQADEAFWASLDHVEPVQPPQSPAHTQAFFSPASSPYNRPTLLTSSPVDSIKSAPTPSRKGRASIAEKTPYTV